MTVGTMCRSFSSWSNNKVLTMLKDQRFWVWLFFIGALSFNGFATHIRGGEITYKRISSQFLTFEFTFTGYQDTGSPVRFGNGLINFGDGREVQIDLEADSFEDGVFIGKNMEVELLKIKIIHTYLTPGTYLISYREPNRNDEIININLGNSSRIPFHINSLVVIDPTIGINSSPVLNTFPLDFGFVAKTFSHNPWAWDPDGDSLSYRVITPKSDRDTVVFNYLKPNHPEFYRSPVEQELGNESRDGPAAFTINPFTGDLVWDAPGNLLKNSQGGFSEYSLALLVEEWRQIDGAWRRIGHVSRDFLVIVEPQDVGRPDFLLPMDQVASLFEPINETIIFEDPDGDPIKVEYFGEVFDLPVNPMTVNPSPEGYAKGPLSLNFQWSPIAEHARSRPYLVHLKIIDNPEDPEFRQSVTYKTWLISFDKIPIITGLPEEPDKHQFHLFPNPTAGRLGWALPNNSDPGILIIYNLMGQQTFSMNLTSYGRREIDVSEFQSGLYFAELTTANKRYRKPFIKE